MQFLAATDPEGESVLLDPDFSDNEGTGATGLDHIQYVMKLPHSVNMADIAVRATMYYQAIPPFYLQQLFKRKDPGDATKRLYYIGQPAGDEGNSHRRLEAPARLRDGRGGPRTHDPPRGSALAGKSPGKRLRVRKVMLVEVGGPRRGQSQNSSAERISPWREPFQTVCMLMLDLRKRTEPSHMATLAPPL